MWKSKNIYLRQVEFNDLQTLLNWENNPENWAVSGINSPFSEEEIIDFIVDQTDVRNNTQLRLMICLQKSNLPIGAVDLFEIDKQKGTAGIGILIDEKKYRKKGYGFESLELLKHISSELFTLKNLYCTINMNNTASINLFLKSGFLPVSEDKNREITEYRFSISH